MYIFFIFIIFLFFCDSNQVILSNGHLTLFKKVSELGGRQQQLEMIMEGHLGGSVSIHDEKLKNEIITEEEGKSPAIIIEKMKYGIEETIKNNYKSTSCEIFGPIWKCYKNEMVYLW